MAVKKKSDPKGMPSKQEIEKMFKETNREAEARARDRIRAAAMAKETADPKTTKKRLDRVLNNDLVKVEVIEPKIPIDSQAISATIYEGLMEFPIQGTHLRLLCMIDPTKEPSTEQRVAMAKRLNEVGPYLPKYIKSIQLRREAPGLPKEEVKESQELNADRQAKREQAPAEREPVVSRTKIAKKMTKTPDAPALTNGVPLKKVCASIDLDPKIARRILRAKGQKPGGRWEWAESEVEGVKKVLQAERSKYEQKGA